MTIRWLVISLSLLSMKISPGKSVKSAPYRESYCDSETKKCTCCWDCPKHANNAGILGSSLTKLIRQKPRLGSMRSIKSFCGFKEIAPFTNSLQSREQICALVNDIGVRKIFGLPRYQLVIEEMYEMNPANFHQPTSELILGENELMIWCEEKTRWRIGVLMRSTSEECRSYRSIVDTLLHELAHCHHRNHSPKFFAEWNYLRRQYARFHRLYLPSLPSPSLGTSAAAISRPRKIFNAIKLLVGELMGKLDIFF